MEGAHSVLTREELLCLRRLSLVLRVLVKSGVAWNRTDLRLFILVALEVFLDQEKALHRHFDLWHMLGARPAQLLEVLSRAREVFEPDLKLNSVGLDSVLLLDGSALFFVSNLVKALFEFFHFIQFDSSEGHRDAGENLVCRSGEHLAHLHRVQVAQMVSLVLSQVELGSGLVDKVGQLDNLVALRCFGGFTIRRFVKLLEQTLFHLRLVSAVLERIEVAEDKLVQFWQVTYVT